MPALLQASMRSVPAGAVIFLPSTVRFTSAMFIAPASRRLSRGRLARAECKQSETCRHSPALRADEKLALRHHGQLFDSPLFLIRTRPAFQMIFKLSAKLFHECDGRHRGRITERAERSTEHVLRQVLH